MKAARPFAQRAGSAGSFLVRRSRLLLDAALILVLVLASIKYTHFVEKIMDIDKWDESFYLYSGVNLLKFGLGPADFSPIYRIWYKLESMVLRTDNFHLYYLNYKLILTLAVSSLYVYMRRVGVPYLIAFIASVLFLVTGNGHNVLEGRMGIEFFPVFIIVLSLIVSTFMRSRTDYYLSIGAGIALLAYARPEYFPLLICCAAAAFIMAIRFSLQNNGNEAMKVGCFALLSCIVISILKDPLPGFKGWDTFAQMFAVVYAARNHLANANPWVNYAAITASVFGNSRSVLAAALFNPGQFLLHILYNIYQYFSCTIDSYTIIFPMMTNTYIDLFNIILKASLFVLLPVTLFIKRDTISKALGPDGIKHYLFLTAVISVPTIIAVLIYMPTFRYLIINKAMILIFASFLASGLALKKDRSTRVSPGATLLFALIMLAAVPNITDGFVLLPLYPSINPEMNASILQTVKIIEHIRSLNISRSVKLCSDGMYYAYLGNNYSWLPFYVKKGRFNDFYAQTGPDIFTIENTVTNWAPFINDRDFRGFLANYRSFGFVRSDVPGTNSYLLIRKSLLPKTQGR